MEALMETTMETIAIMPQQAKSYNVSLDKGDLKLKYMQNMDMLIAKGPSDSMKVMSYYYDIIDFVKNHFDGSSKLNCYFDYSAINGTTIKLLFNLFEVLNKAHLLDKNVAVYWVLNSADEEVQQIGMEFSNYYNFKFVLSHN